MQIENFISDLDSKRFGFKIAKFDTKGVDLAIFLELIRSERVKLIITKVPLENLEAVNLLEENGFVIKDVQVTYKFELNKFIPHIISESKNEIIIRDATDNDIKGVEILAGNCFSNYGHYAADLKLPSDKVKDIYSDWARRSIEDKNIADKIIIAEINNEIAGFLTFKVYEQNGLFYGAGGLGGVAEKYRSQNIFRLITIAGLKWGKQRNMAWEEHNVSIKNYPVNSSFTKLGFKIYKTFVTMHCWI